MQIRERDDIRAAEYSIECHGLSFLCIIGEHINGGFIAIVDWGVAAELGDKDDIRYNADSIFESLERTSCLKYLPRDEKARYTLAKDIALAVREIIIWRNTMQIKNYHEEYAQHKTVRQWALEGYVPKKDAKGVELWADRNCQSMFVYYSPDEVEPATK